MCASLIGLRWPDEETVEEWLLMGRGIFGLVFIAGGVIALVLVLIQVVLWYGFGIRWRW